MTNLDRILCGLNMASLIRGWRFGWQEFEAACIAGLSAVHPRQDRASHDLELQLKSIPTVTLDEILGVQKALISVEIQKYEDGMLPAHEAIALLSMLVAESPKEVLEIGTFMGHTTKAMARNLPGGLIHTVDLPPDFAAQEPANPAIPKDDFHLIRKRVVGREFKGQPVEVRIKQHFGDTAKIDFQEFGRPDFFFIDGSHTYEYCKQDSEKCHQLCNGRGTFFWHDCDESHPGVVKFVNEWRAAGRKISRIHGTNLAYWKSPEPAGR
ncbi:MAG: class I SAM-dependent methyltransferase [Verrucomicrobiota bacterium]|jgi:predicted O-methyltransferase YrrM